MAKKKASGKRRTAVRKKTKAKKAPKRKPGRRKSKQRTAKSRKARGKKTSITALLKRAQETLTREVLASTMGRIPHSTSMGEIISSVRAAGLARDFEAMSLGELVTAIMGVEAREKRVQRQSGRKTRKRSSRTKVVTRTEGGRAALDAAVSAFLKNKRTPLRAEDIRGAVGGTAAQVRQSLARLVTAGKATKTGQKRGTQYTWKA